MKPYYEHAGITIYHGDCREILPQLPEIDLVVTSPPYAAQREYGLVDFDWDAVIPPALASVNLTADGQVLVNLGMVHRDGEVACYWEPLTAAMRAAGHRLFGWYVWDQGFGLPGDWNGRLAPSHEFVFHFNRQSRPANKTISTQQRKASGRGLRNPDGSIKPKSSPEKCGQPFKVSDSVIRVFREMRRDVDHPAVYPLEFAATLIAAFDGSVLDPFVGSGTTLRAAKDLGRRAIGVDINERYCEIAAKRLAQEVLPLEIGA